MQAQISTPDTRSLPRNHLAIAACNKKSKNAPKTFEKEATKQTESQNASKPIRQEILIKNKFAHDHGVHELGSDHP